MEARRFPAQPPGRSRQPGSGQTECRDYSKAMWAEAVRKMRTYVTANRLDLFVTPTNATGVRSLDLVRKHCRAFVLELRRIVYEGAKMPWLYVPEYHEVGTIHTHWFLPREVAPVVEEVWHRGTVDIVELSDVDAQRDAVIYVSEYFDAIPPGARRYEVARGFKPEYRDYDVGDVPEADAVADQVMDGRPRSKKQPRGTFGCETTYYDEF